MEDKLEELLNSLIEKGWRPFGERSKSVEYLYEGDKFYFKNIPGELVGAFYCNIRELVSKESGLWQFCAENRMVDGHKYDSKTYEVRIENWIKQREVGPEGEVYTQRIWRPRHSAEYRLIESALTDESELESFILNNIQLGQ